MSKMIEVFYPKPPDFEREQAIAAGAAGFGGKVTCREDDAEESICLTIEFADWDSAEKACAKLQALGEHVEGPQEYGDD